VLGPDGSGRHSSLLSCLGPEAAVLPVPSDWVYVNNFDAPDRPRAIAMPPGTARPLQKAIQQVVDDLAHDIPAMFESEQYQTRRSGFEQRLAERKQAGFEKLLAKAGDRSVTILRTPTGYTIAGIRQGEVIKPDDFAGLDESERKSIENGLSATEKELEKYLRSVPRLEKEHRAAVARLNAEMAEQAVDDALEEVLATFGKIPDIGPYLETLRAEMIKNGELFLGVGGGRREGPLHMARAQVHDDPAFHRYAINVVVTNEPSRVTGAPIVAEPMPTLNNLIGRMDLIPIMGALVTDFTMIRPGALHRANGGFLILDAIRILAEPMAWDALKRCLETREIRTNAFGDPLNQISTNSLEPEPIPLQIRIALVGSPLVHLMLTLYDPDFPRFFKVAAEFADDMPRSPESVALFARMVSGACRQDGLRHVQRDGVAALIDVAARMAEDRDRMSLRIGALWDLLREADFLAEARGQAKIDGALVAQARTAAEHRADLVRERLHDSIRDGTIIVSTSGSEVGQVNGLTVTSNGLFTFGFPVRITARVRMGTGKVIDIEREVKTGGPVHSKGVLILSAYLAGHYAPEVPLSLWASLVFEQTYGGVEGDSASVAELCALLSALANMPSSQSIAVTGSINQMGEVQPVGAVNEKIEGYFDTCRAVGLTGQQGVIVPRRNLRNLMLRADVVDAVAKGQFRVYAISHVDEAMEILTGMIAGRRTGTGAFEDGSVNANVERRLVDFANGQRDFVKSAEEETPGEP